MSTSWLHRHVHGVLLFACRTYYRVTVAGPPMPDSGPLLVVANHPNSLLDPALVAVAANRPVRFLARAGLFRQRSIGWLIRASGAIPVHRPGDEPDGPERNRAMFSDAAAVLRDHGAIGIFPEGVSHSEPSLFPVRTGAARIAFAAARDGARYDEPDHDEAAPARTRPAGPFPIIPVGLTFRGGKERFRSEALLLVGRPVRWDDLAAQHGGTAEAVRELTSRIESALERVTVNVESWEDFEVVEAAEAIHHAEYGRDRPGSTVRWLARMRRTAGLLLRARSGDSGTQEPLARAVVDHVRMLDGVGLRPRDLHEVPRASVAARWVLRHVAFFGLLAPFALVGAVVFFLPYRFVGWAEGRFAPPLDKRATYKVLGGAAACGGWILLIAAALREIVGWRPAMLVLAALPLLGLLTLAARDRLESAAAALRRVLVLRGRTDLRDELRRSQKGLAERIRSLQRDLRSAHRAHRADRADRGRREPNEIRASSTSAPLDRGEDPEQPRGPGRESP